MRLTKIPLLILFICLAANIRVSALDNQADSLTILFREIIALSKENNSCKNFSDYQKALIEIKFENTEDDASVVKKADSLFLKANMNRNCTLLKPISRLQAILKTMNLSDTLSLTRAFLYARSKFSGYVHVQLKMTPVSNPSVFVQSLDPFIVPIQYDSSAAELYLLPGKKYGVTISVPGYDSISRSLVAQRDTILNISLSKTEEPPVVPGQNGNNKRIIGLWWIPVALILLFLLTWALYKKGLFVNKNSSKGDDSKSLKIVKESLQKQEVLVNQYREEIKILKSKQDVHGKDIPSDKYFQSEIMMTAGPRKKMNVDRDLGEDVCGFIVSGNEVLAWLMDGSSDFFDPLINPETKREYFSSRLLAQSLGRKVRSILLAEKSFSLDAILDKIIKQVKDEWLERINSLPDTEKSVLRKNLKDGIKPDCASTVLIARFMLNGDLKVCRTGDSKLLSFIRDGEHVNVDTALSTKNNQIGPVSFLLALNQNDFDIIIRQSNPEITERSKIQSVIGFSDGIGKATEKTLIKEYVIDAEKARDEIITQLQGTGDDKSLFIIDIIEV
jgi:hypothetical protein